MSTRERAFELFKTWRQDPTVEARDLLLQEFLPDMLERAQEFADQLPEEHEVSDLLHAAILKLLDAFESCRETTADDFLVHCSIAVDVGIREELEFAIQPTKGRRRVEKPDDTLITPAAPKATPDTSAPEATDEEPRA